MSDRPTTPSAAFQSVVPSDIAPLVRESRAIYVGGAGDVAVLGSDGSTAIFKAVPAGALLPIVVTQVLATGTNATSLVALF